MQLSDLTSRMTRSELGAVLDENCEPFTSAQQCDVFLRAATMYLRRDPKEIEHQGERALSRDWIEQQAVEARKQRAVFNFSCGPVTVIVPACDY